MLKIFLLILPTILWAHSMDDLKQVYFEKGDNYKARTKHIDKNNHAKYTNHLILESSPYLLQHAHNPVNWYSFSDEAFEKAKQENKPIFISIGYATCHWCHVMEEESFDDIDVAQVLNKYFVSIKVDREIRPDVDASYMQVSQLLNGDGGWPLNAVLMPDGRAFFAGVYFTKEELIKILLNIQRLWKNENEKLIDQAGKIDKILNSTSSPNETLESDIMSKSLQAIMSNFDDLEGGFSNAPKFPQESLLLLLINEQKRHPSADKLNAINLTLEAMASGGLYDVVGGGFHRYSIDNSWVVPHFEKMLYNQAQLSRVYAQAYQITRKPLYKRVAMQTLDYVLKEMQSTNNGFFSATDADSADEEGRFFTWSIKELENTLNPQELELFKSWFDISHSTNFEDRYIVHFSDINGINESEYSQIDRIINKLYSAREKRQWPFTDEKILLSWNALLLKSLLEAGNIFNEIKYINSGLELANYLHNNFYKDKKLNRYAINNQTVGKALFEDYAYLTDAYITVFDTTNDEVWINRAVELVDIMNQQFWDKDNFGFYTSVNNKYINTNNKVAHDGAITPANALMYQIFSKLNNRLEDAKYTDQMSKLLEAFANRINQDPYNYSTFILGIANNTYGELSNPQYVYSGRVRINTIKDLDDKIIVEINTKPLWHINSNKPLQDSLVATNITSNNPNWNIENIKYPLGKLVKLGFSNEKISVYEGTTLISFELINKADEYTTPTLELKLQACGDKVCLPPNTVTITP